MIGRLILDSVEVDDVQFLAESGESLERIAARVGVKPNTIMKTLERHGRKDILTLLSANRPAPEMSR